MRKGGCGFNRMFDGGPGAVRKRFADPTGGQIFKFEFDPVRQLSALLLSRGCMFATLRASLPYFTTGKQLYINPLRTN